MSILRISVCLFSCLVLLSCGRISQTPQAGSGYLSLNITYTPAGPAKVRFTTFDSVIINISSDGMDPLRYARRLSNSQGNFIDTLNDIPSGESRLVEAYTVNRAGQRIHYGSGAVNIEAGSIAQLSLYLSALRGSICIQLSDVPPKVDSLRAVFAWQDDSLVTNIKRPSGTFANIWIDNVPNGISGTLRVSCVDTSKSKTKYWASTPLTFVANQLTTLYLHFQSELGTLGLALSISDPGIAMATGSMTNENSVISEEGPLIITEIMYNAGTDSDYIELHNPTADTVRADSLILEIVGGLPFIRYLRHVVIAPGGFFVCGGGAKTPPDWRIDTLVGIINLPSTTERWLYVKTRTGAVMDWVGYSIGYSEWPTGRKNSSIEIDSNGTNPGYNNFGRHWRTSEKPILQTAGYFGSPGE